MKKEEQFVAVQNRKELTQEHVCPIIWGPSRCLHQQLQAGPSDQKCDCTRQATEISPLGKDLS